MSQELQYLNVFNSDTVDKIKKICNTIEPARWTRRTALAFPRAIGNSSCRYDFCGQSQMSADIKEQLTSLAPTFDGFPLAEVALNRYNIGDYIGNHRDRDLYRLNLVISLQADGDGLEINSTNEFIEDRAGQGVLITGVGPIHSVPPVKHLRYSLIYLYE